MATIFFKINTIQENEIQSMMKAEGYTSKAEFFRFLIKFYKYNKSPTEINLEKEAEKLAKTLIRLDKEGKLNKSLDEQLADI